LSVQSRSSGRSRDNVHVVAGIGGDDGPTSGRETSSGEGRLDGRGSDASRADGLASIAVQILDNVCEGIEVLSS
jgi:hypothetical protein